MLPPDILDAQVEPFLMPQPRKPVGRVFGKHVLVDELRGVVVADVLKVTMGDVGRIELACLFRDVQEVCEQGLFRCLIQGQSIS